MGLPEIVRSAQVPSLTASLLARTSRSVDFGTRMLFGIAAPRARRPASANQIPRLTLIIWGVRLPLPGESGCGCLT